MNNNCPIHCENFKAATRS